MPRRIRDGRRIGSDVEKLAKFLGKAIPMIIKLYMSILKDIVKLLSK